MGTNDQHLISHSFLTIACRVPGPFHEPCTAFPRALHCSAGLFLQCIVGVAGGTFATISDSTVEHLADSFLGLPDAHAIVKHMIPKSKSYGSCSCTRHDPYLPSAPVSPLTLHRVGVASVPSDPHPLI